VNEPTDPQSFVSSSVPPALGIPLPVPMTFGQILDRTYRLMREHFRLFIGIAVVPAASIFVFLAAMAGIVIEVLGSHLAGKPVAQPVPPPWFPLFLLIGYPFATAVYAFYMPAASFASTQADLGVKVSIRQAYGEAWSHFGRYLWLMILCILCVVVPVAVMGALIGGGAVLLEWVRSSPAGAFFLVPLLAMLYLGIFIYSTLIILRLAVAYPACVEERLTAWSAIRRSAKLTRNAAGRIFLVLLIVYAVAYAVSLVGVVVLFALGSLGVLAAMGAHVVPGSPVFFILVSLGVLVYLVVVVAATLISYSAMTAALAVLYHDQRRRRDNLAPASPLS
jgi:hypothetical protein